MKNKLLLIIFLIIVGCSSNKTVYWCGDHACANKKEKEEYFKKTMIVEIREIELKDKKYSDTEKILQQVKSKKKLSKKEQKRINKIARVKKKKEFTLVEEKEEFKRKKKIDKIALLDKKKEAKRNKKLKKLNDDKNKVILSNFDELVNIIIKRNKSKTYPDINDTKINYE